MRRVFFDQDKKILKDVKHSQKEARYILLGKTKKGRLKPTTQLISIRIPKILLNQIKERANELNIPYQSLIKIYLKKGVLGR